MSIAQHDLRTTLRRGAAEGFAEVDFVGNDGVSYRARWTVRRARSKADGKLQNRGGKPKPPKIPLRASSCAPFPAQTTTTSKGEIRYTYPQQHS